MSTALYLGKREITVDDLPNLNEEDYIVVIHENGGLKYGNKILGSELSTLISSNQDAHLITIFGKKERNFLKNGKS